MFCNACEDDVKDPPVRADGIAFSASKTVQPKEAVNRLGRGWSEWRCPMHRSYYHPSTLCGRVQIAIAAGPISWSCSSLKSSFERIALAQVSNKAAGAGASPVNVNLENV